jgi:predicted dehydrogenase
MRIGIVGAENSHCVHIAKALNLESAFPECRVTHVWGETPELAAKAAEEAQIPTIVGDYEQMIGQVDGVVIDHRDGKHHLPAARPFVEAGIPVFVDKPFCTDLAEGVEFVRFARSKGVPITSFSVVSLQRSVKDFAAAAGKLGRLRAVQTAGPCDVQSEYGGVFFYGIHQVELVTNLLGLEAVQVVTARSGDDALATVVFDSGPIVTHAFLKDWWAVTFAASAYGDDGAHHAELPFDEKMYLPGIELFCRMFQSGEEPLPPAAYLRPVAILEAMDRSLGTGTASLVERLPEI